MPQQMGLPVPRGIHPEVPQESDLRRTEAKPRRSAEDAGRLEAECCGGGAPNAEPRSHPDVDTTEILRGSGHRVHQGQDRNLHCPELQRQEAKFRRAALLGAGLLRVDSRAR